MADRNSTRTCKKCAREVPLERFTFAHGVYTYECKECTRVRQREWANEKRRAMRGVSHVSPNDALKQQGERLWMRMISRRRITPAKCWEWTGAIRSSGYGKIEISLDGIPIQASTHRVAAVLFHGLDIDDRAAVVMHKCDNKTCFNPDHLQIGDARLNMQDAYAKGRVNHYRGETAPSAVFSEIDVLRILTRVKSGETVVSIARDYGHISAIYGISQRKTWKHLDLSV
jgi:hypothetical protein